MKRNKILIFIMLLAFLSLTFFGLKVSATTSTDSSLLTIEGAQVRLEGVNGIRFKGNVSTTFDKTGVTRYGIALAFGEVPVSDVVVGNTVNGKSVLYGEVTDLVDDSYYVNLINVPETMYGQKVTARSYVVKDGVRLYSDTAKTRSLGYVALYAKSQGYSSTLLDLIVTTLSNNYMKAYTVGDNVHINNSVYVYEPTKLAEYFIKDFNEVTGESITTMVGFAKAYMGAYVAEPGTFSKTDIQTNKLYVFYNSENMLTKWGWLLDYIYENSSSLNQKSYVGIQRDYINGKTELTESNDGWYGCRHLLGRFEGFFTRAKVTSTAYNSSEFNTNNVYPNLIETINKLDNSCKYYSEDNLDLLLIGSKIDENALSNTGYKLSSYTIDSTEYQVSEGYTLTNSPIELVPNFAPVEYTITFMNGEEEITSLSRKYTIEDEVTLSDYVISGKEFCGWYESSSLDGDQITSIPVGSTGNKVFYADLLVQVEVNYNLNGGSFGRYSSTEEAIADFINDFNAFHKTRDNYTGIQYTAETFSALTASQQPILYNSSFFYDENYKAKWSWLVNYIATVAGTNNKNAFVNFYNYSSATALNNANSNYIYCVTYEIRGWVGQKKYTSNSNFVSADYGSTSVKASTLAEVLAVESAATSYTYAKPCDLLTPRMNDATFLGWKSSLDGSITKEFSGYKENPGLITYTAIWEVSKPMIDGIVYDSLADAVAAANEGDEIYVPAGTYDEDFTISTNNITIKGANSDVFGSSEQRGEETILKGTITISGADDVTINGCDFQRFAQVVVSGTVSNFKFEYNIVEITNDIDGIVYQPSSSTITNMKISYNYGANYNSSRFVKTDGVINGLEMNNNEIIGTGLCLDFLRSSNVVKGKVSILNNKFSNSVQSFLMVQKIGVIECEIKGNVIASVKETAIDFRDMAENGDVSFIIENNKFVNCARVSNTDGWDVIRIRTAGYDSNDSLYILVTNNKFIDSFVYDGGTCPIFVDNPSYNIQSAPFKAIYTIGRNYYEIKGVPYTNLTAANFNNAAISFGEAYATEAEVPGF